jgi:aminoglycoside phosphotransferase family enzyme/predicted kinase
MSESPAPGVDRAHVVADQSAAFALLADPRTHGLSSPPIRIETQGAVIFLADANAYKVKRAVKFPFMDLSTLARRKAACEAEVAVNAINAPEIYLGVVPITKRADGLTLGGSGEPIEWAVHMRRFDEHNTLDHVADREGLPPALIAELVRAILASHARAPIRNGAAAAESLRRYLRQNNKAFAESPELFPRDRVAALTARSDAMLTSVWKLLIARGRLGFARRCHGDLHLRNVVLIRGEPTLFDAVEFDDAIATGDVLYDLAFLLMDLWERGLKSEANLVLNRYLWASDEEHIAGLAALPILLSIRAAIRAKVLAASLPHLADGERDEMAAEARRYFSAAEAFLEPAPARLIALGGLSGSGKTTLAGAMAPFIGRAPGAVHLRSDVERKLEAGVAETDRLPQSHYTSAATAAVYASLRRKARLALGAGHSVVVDAVHARLGEREALAALAADCGVPFTGIWLEAPMPVLVERVRARIGDASDATEEVILQQTGYDIGLVTWHRLAATGELAQCTAEALRLVGGPRSSLDDQAA